MKPLIPFEPVRRDEIPSGGQWLHQVKWDGVRILAYGEHSELRLYNRKRRERTAHYPELADKPFISARSFITDGEMIALAHDGKPSFHQVMRRDGLRRTERVREVRKLVPVTYMIFDLLYCNGEWLTERPLEERIERLRQTIDPNQHVQLVDTHEDGQALFDVIRKHGMEGIVCKQRERSYAAGGKDDRWIKVKNYGETYAVIGGYTLNGTIVNAVLLGLYDQVGRLHYIGKVGTGKLARAEWGRLTERLGPDQIEERPFHQPHPDMKGAFWVRPQIVVHIRYTEWRKEEGRMLRQPSIQRFVDMPPRLCTLD